MQKLQNLKNYHTIDFIIMLYFYTICTVQAIKRFTETILGMTENAHTENPYGRLEDIKTDVGKLYKRRLLEQKPYIALNGCYKYPDNVTLE